MTCMTEISRGSLGADWSYQDTLNTRTAAIDSLRKGRPSHCKVMKCRESRVRLCEAERNMRKGVHGRLEYEVHDLAALGRSSILRAC